MSAPDGSYGGGLYGGGVYGGGVPTMPRIHVRIALDRDGYDLGGICTGVNSTTEDLGDWQGLNATLTLNDAVSLCYTGSHCIRVTAAAAGQASAIIYGLGGVGAIEGGRTYLLWVHVRPDTVVRDARAVLLWKSATDVYLTAQASPLIAAPATGYTRIGVLATAPPGAGRLDIAVDWLDCAAGESHYLDTVTVEDVGTDVSPWFLAGECTLSGRNQALGQTEAGTAKITLDNGDGRFTPGRGATTIAPFGGNIVPRRRLWILAEYLGVLYPIWSGYTVRWTQAIPASLDGASEVTVDCTDGFRWLTAAAILPPYRAQILADRPLSYYPLDEASEATSAGDLVAGAPAALRIAASGDGKSAFGGTSVLPKLETGQTTDNGSTSLAFNQADDLGTSGAVLDLRYAGGVPPVASGWTFECWITAPTEAPGLAQILFRHVVPIGATDYLSGFQLLILDTGQLRLVTGGSETVATSAPSICNGGSYHVAITYEPGGTFGTAALWLNGGQVGELELTANPMPVGSPVIAQLGGAMSDITSEPSFLFTGSAGHVAFWYRRLADLELYLHALAGRDGFRLETEADRLAAILQMVGWPVEDSRIDAGLTELVPRAWAETNPLALSQDTAASAGSVVVMDALGRLHYPHRHRWVNWVPVQADFRVGFGTEVEAGDFQPWLDDTGIANVVKVDRIGGAKIAVRDEASISRYGPIEGEAIPLGAAEDDEALIHAQWVLSRTAEPHTRIDTVTVRPDTAGSILWSILLPLEFGHRITIGDAPTTAPDPEIDALVGQIKHAFGNEEWVTTLRLEAAVIDTVWVLDDPVLGVLDTPNCVLGY
jgi:hypothetical protein